MVEILIKKLIKASGSYAWDELIFMPGHETTDAIFISKQLQEKTVSKNGDFHFTFRDFKKALDQFLEILFGEYYRYWE